MENHRKHLRTVGEHLSRAYLRSQWSSLSNRRFGPPWFLGTLEQLGGVMETGGGRKDRNSAPGDKRAGKRQEGGSFCSDGHGGRVPCYCSEGLCCPDLQRMEQAGVCSQSQQRAGLRGGYLGCPGALGPLTGAAGCVVLMGLSGTVEGQGDWRR